jgi:hypothetical protein
MAEANAPLTDDLTVCEKTLTQIFEMYADIEKLSTEIADVSGDMKSAYAKVIFDKCWKACKLCHSFNQEMLARLGSFETRVRDIHINTVA